jgi:hypothetical protein
LTRMYIGSSEINRWPTIPLAFGPIAKKDQSSPPKPQR